MVYSLEEKVVRQFKKEGIGLHIGSLVCKETADARRSKITQEVIASRRARGKILVLKAVWDGVILCWTNVTKARINCPNIDTLGYIGRFCRVAAKSAASLLRIVEDGIAHLRGEMLCLTCQCCEQKEGGENGESFH